MRKKIKKASIINWRYLIICTFAGFLMLINGCKKADNFYEKLDGLLQVDVTTGRAYGNSYVVGDTLQIYGRLKAKQNLEVWINNTRSEIIEIDSTMYFTSERDTAYMDRVRLLISDNMIGNNVPVEFRNGDLRGTGPSINVLSYYGENSFEQELTQQLTYTFPDRNNTFLYCASGKGDVYYYAQADKRIRHIFKNGTTDDVLDLSLPFPDGSVPQEFLAGGVDPDMKNLYFSLHTDKGYSLYKLTLSTQSLTLLNTSTDIDKPFGGKLSDVGIIATSVYPDKDGNLYLGIGLSVFGRGLPAALGYYAATAQSFTYLYRWDGSIPGLPAELLPQNTTHRFWRLNPDEKLLYVFTNSYATSSNDIDIYDVGSKVKLQTVRFSPIQNQSGDTKDVQFVGRFPLKIAIGDGYDPDLLFGLMPMPGNRLQSLYNQRSGSPKWLVLDFVGNRSYAYGKGTFDQGSYAFNPTRVLFPQNTYVDELLNWDEDGHLYMSSNGKKVLLKTKTR